ncbi:MAG: trypsin-like peptidase domain-containing protein [Planctomycetia bacterium]|nr:trypsin-like peptidase domain-containing protein [Planctomycetia bacterium]
MSLSRNNRVWGVAESLLDRMTKKRKARAHEQKSTKLAIDRLEERQMLSLTVGTTENLLVNESWQDIRGDIAVDSNESGDVIVAWTAADRLKNPNYDPTDETSSYYLLDDNGDYVEDLNVYARYLTNEVQIITLPEECVPGKVETTDGSTLDVKSGSFELIYNAYETQRLSIFNSNFSVADADVYPTSNSRTSLYLGLYAEGELTWVLWNYDAKLTPSDNAANLQEVIRAIPGDEYSEVEVSAYSETDFDVTFKGDQWAGYDLTDIRVSNDYYDDVTALIDKISAITFDVTELQGCTVFQKLILKDLFTSNYSNVISNKIKTSGRKDVIKTLQSARDSLVDNLTSAVVTTVKEVQTVTTYNNKGNAVGIVVSSDPIVTARNIQDAFNGVTQQASLYAPITRGYEYNEKTHRFEYTSEPTRAYSSNESYGSMQSAISPISVSVDPIMGKDGEYLTNQFKITFKGSSGLINQDPLMISAASYSVKVGSSYNYQDVISYNSKTGAYEFSGVTDFEIDESVVTVKESSCVFRVNAPEIVDFAVDEDGDLIQDRWGEYIISGTGRTDQYKPDVAMSADGSVIITWVDENADSLQSYNATDIKARRFQVQGYLPLQGEAGYDANYQPTFYDNGAKLGVIGYVPESDLDSGDASNMVADPYALASKSDVLVQCIAPVADEFVVNAYTNGVQTDPTISADLDGNFIIAWTYIAQDNSYFGGIYGRQYDNLAQPTTGDITFASSQVSSNYYGPAYAAMADSGFAVVMWNYGADLYQAALEPYSDVFIIDNQLVANNAYGSDVDFDYNERYAMVYSQEDASEAAGTTSLPTTDVYITIYNLTKSDDADEEENAFDYTSTTTTTTTGTNTSSTTNNTNNGDNTTDLGETGLWVGLRQVSTKYTAEQVLDATLVNPITVADQGNPSVGVDADGDVFVAYQGLGMDIQSISAANLQTIYSTDYDDLYIQLTWKDFEDNNLAYENKRFLRGNKYSYENKNEDLIYYIKMALGWGYDQYGDFSDVDVTPVYELHNYDCIDVDSYIRYFLGVAQNEKASNEQVMRLAALLETLLSPLRNNGNDISYVNYGQTVYGDSIATTTSTDNNNNNDTTTSTTQIITDASVVSGVVSNYRNGSNACFYVSVPNDWVGTASISLRIGRLTDKDNIETNLDTCETVTIDVSGYYNTTYGYINDWDGYITAVSDALNSLEICGGDENCFVVRYVPQSEIEFYRDTVGEIKLATEDFEYIYAYTVDNVTYYGTRTIQSYGALQITAQSSLHDTPLFIDYDVDASTIKLLGQVSDDLNYVEYFDPVYVERYGSIGNSQTNAHVAETSNGDVLVVWAMQADSTAKQRSDVYPSIGNSIDTSYTHIYMRPFVESTDTAGPIVTNVSLPNGTKVDDGQTVTSALRDIVVSFSEDLITVGDGASAYNNQHAVDNPSNWRLLRDGVEVTGAIESVTFGMNASVDLARETVDENGDEVEEINDGALAYGTNRWEAIVTFAEGHELSDGNYTLVCTSMVQDTARNAIYSQGYAADGSAAGYDGKDWSIDFNVLRLNEALGFEYSKEFPRDNFIPVNEVHGDASDGNPITEAENDETKIIRQVTRSNILEDDSDYGPNTANAVACNSNGDYVVVWVESEGSVESGTVEKTVYARTYRVLYMTNADGERVQVVKDADSISDPIKVYQTTNTYDEDGKLTSGTDPRQASVAMSDMGDFCVVWDMLTSGVDEDGSRDVYMAKYAFNHTQLKINGNSTSPTRANVYTDGAQQYPSVAMDADGDIVVVWESYNQDGSGWGVFGRRFLSNGMSYGYCNTIQTLEFIDSINIQGDKITLSGNIDGVVFETTVALTVAMKTNAKAIHDALVAQPAFTSIDGFSEDDIVVAVTSAGVISIEFTGSLTAQYIDMLEVETSRSSTVTDPLRVNVATRQVGVTGTEFQVNQTTENNQRFASIGMEPDGSFVVSWTSWGQDNDSNIESNIYARKFASNHLVSTSTFTVEEMTPSDSSSKVITLDDIDGHEVYAGDGYESVCFIQVGDTVDTTTGGTTNNDANDVAVGTGSLLTTRRHILTAAHVVCDDNGVPIDLTDTPIYCTFETKSGVVTIPVASIYVHPTYAGDPADNQVDLAVLTLQTSAPASLTGYELYTGSSELGQTITFVGYGTYGDVGDTEDEIDDRNIGRKHYGQNVYELTGADFDLAGNPNTLVYDFDDGTYANDYLGNYYGIRNLGLGTQREAITAPGDSGSPSFINGQIAGVCSYGSNFGIEDSFGPGNYQVDVRVSAYVDWINQAILSGLGDEFLVNTEATITVVVDDDDDDNNNNNNNNNDTTVVDTTASDFWQRGNQIWSSVAMDGFGNFVITWTGYNQDGNGDGLTGGSNYGLGGVFMRAFVSDPETAELNGSAVKQVNEYTAYDQIHSQVAMSRNGYFTIVYESYQDPSNDETSDLVDNFGIFARRYQLTTDTVALTDTTTSTSTGNNNTTSTTTTVTYVTSHDIKTLGQEFEVSRQPEAYITANDKDQLGGSVAIDSNGDMVFAWSDLSHPKDNIESVVCVRAVALAEDTIPPYVTRVNAIYNSRTTSNDDGELESIDAISRVSLYNDNVTFASGNGPTSLVYTFSEYMFSAQMNADMRNYVESGDTIFESSEKYDEYYRYLDKANLENRNVKSVLDFNDWILTLDGKAVTSTYIYDIIYGYNASAKVEDYLRSKGLSDEVIATLPFSTVCTESAATNDYELVILFKDVLPDGTYTLTLSDNVTDACGQNRLDGDYDGKSGGAFTVRWNIGATIGEYEPDKIDDQEAFTYAGQGDPVVVSNSEGFIIVTEQQVLYELGTTSGSTSGNNNNNNNNNTGTGYDEVHGYYNTIVIDNTLYRIESDIVMRHFNADGEPDGVERRVNSYSTGNQISPDIALTETGDYVVAWIGESSEALNGVCARFYPGGQAQQNQVQVAGTKGMRCWDVDVCISESGLVLITWLQGSKDNGTEADEMYGRFYNVNGEALSTAFKIIPQIDSYSVEHFDVAPVTYNGQLNYVCVWQIYNKATKSFEIYQKVITAHQRGKYYYATGGDYTRVNDTTIHGQYAPQIAASKNSDEYYIVWVSDQNQANGGDIYAKRFDTAGNSLVFLGTTGEALVNVQVKNVQGRPAVACNADGVVFAWESFDVEEYNYNSSVDVRLDQHDYGIAVRVFNSAGEPVYVTGDVLEEINGVEQLVAYQYGQQVSRDLGEFVINTTTSGDQLHPTVAVFDWTQNGLSQYKIPKFVVSWAGPNPDAGEEIEDDDSTNNSTSGNNNNNNNNNNTTTDTSYVGPFIVLYKLISAGTESSGDSAVVSSNTKRYGTDPANETSGGFYRPIANEVENLSVSTSVGTIAGKSESNVFTINGTSGDDRLVVVMGASGVTSITLNGVAQAFDSDAIAIQFLGDAGNDTVVYQTSGNETISVDSATGKASFAGAQKFVVSQVETINVEGEVDYLALNASAKGDLVTLGSNGATMTTNAGLTFSAADAKTVVANGNNKATVVLTGDQSDNTLTAVGSSVTFVGAAFEFEANSFAVTRAIAGAGNNTANIAGVTNAVATDAAFVGATAKGSIAAVGFQTVDAKGAGFASLDIRGTRGDDSFNASEQNSQAHFSTGAILNASGFSAVSFDGGEGQDSAVLQAGTKNNVFEGWGNRATLTNGVLTQNVSNVSNVTVYGNDDDDVRSTLLATLHDTEWDDAFTAVGNVATQSVNGARLYSIIAADQVAVKRDLRRGDDSLDVDDALDFVFASENWDDLN